MYLGEKKTISKLFLKVLVSSEVNLLLTYQLFVCKPLHKQTVAALLQKVHPHCDPVLLVDLGKTQHV